MVGGGRRGLDGIDIRLRGDIMKNTNTSAQERGIQPNIMTLVESPTDYYIEQETSHYNAHNAIRDPPQCFGPVARDDVPFSPFWLGGGTIDRKISIPTINKKTTDLRTPPRSRRPHTIDNSSGRVKIKCQNTYQQ
jgi:hypothetical protein